MKKISVCVPAYNRPHMTEQLIWTYLNQDYPDRELVISDDSTDDSVQEMVRSFDNPTIRYSRNPKNLGYCRNLFKVLQEATGDYIVIMGDDDLLISRRSLTGYVDTFNRYEDVAYIYSNMLQVSPELKIDYVYRFFPRDTYFQKGEDAFSKMWITSIFIAGIGLRNSFKFDELYPEGDILFPQTELVGRIINSHSAFGISEFLIAARAHEDQLGFFALRGERIKGEEKYWTTEMFSIFNRLNDDYHFYFDDEFLSRQVIRQYSIMIMKDKMLAGNKNVRDSYRELCSLSEAAKNSMLLRSAYLTSLVLPGFAIKVIRSVFIGLRKMKDRKIIRGAEKDLVSILEYDS